VVLQRDKINDAKEKAETGFSEFDGARADRLKVV